MVDQTECGCNLLEYVFEMQILVGHRSKFSKFEIRHILSFTIFFCLSNDVLINFT